MTVTSVIWVLVVFTTLFFQNVYSWDNMDFELFDLIEEVQPHTFYQILGVDKAASSSEVRKAYRKLSLQFHPDKNKEEGAEETFRKLVAVAEVLRDEEKRKRYDEILVNGLPDWRQPVFYYRRVRKMGLLETVALLSIILTLGHYIVMWSMYWERKFELESLMKPKKEKKNKKSSKQTEETNQDPAALLEDEQFLPRPKMKDILPLKILRAMRDSGTNIFYFSKHLASTLKEKWENRNNVELEEEEDDDNEEQKREKKPRDKLKVFSEIYDFERTNNDTQSAIEEVKKGPDMKKDTPWSHVDTKVLVKSIAKYPGGTTDRWEKIAEDVGRDVSEVLKKAKEIKTKGFVTSVDASIQGITGGVKHTVVSKQTGKNFIKDDTISLAPEDDPDALRRRKRQSKPTKDADRTTMITEITPNQSQEENLTDCIVEDLVHTGVESCSWSQRQQKILEKALTIYPKGTPERWEKIAASVPGKTKEECVTRFKELVEIIRRKKQIEVKEKSDKNR